MVRDTSLPPSHADEWGADGRPAQADPADRTTEGISSSAAGGIAVARPAAASQTDAGGAADDAPGSRITGVLGSAEEDSLPDAGSGHSQADGLACASWRRWNRSGWPAAAWLLVWLLSLVAYVIAGRRDAMLFYAVWVCFAVMWGLRISGLKPTLWVLAAMIATAVAAVGLDAAWPDEPAGRLVAALLMTAVFIVMVWQVHRRQSADAERARVSEENARLLATQRRFLQDASHQLRTPITIALGHAELLARDLAGRVEQRDIHVVVGELARLKSLSETLLLIASSEDREFLRLEPVALDSFIMEALRRWLPAAQRRWRLGHLDLITVRADRERLGLAIDALLENAVQHTGTGDQIKLSVLRDDVAQAACVVIEDSGEGIAAADLESIFERFRTGSAPSSRSAEAPRSAPEAPRSAASGGRPPEAPRRTGLGLALVRAVARGHGGEVRVRSTPGAGSRFEFVLPAKELPEDVPSGIGEPAQASDPRSEAKLR